MWHTTASPNIRHRCEHGSIVAELSGEIDIVAGPGIGIVLDDLTRSWYSLLAVDLRPVTFMDSTALHLLLRARTRVLQRQGVLRVVSTRPLLPRILVATGLEEHFPLHRSIDDTGPFTAAHRSQAD
ncbi:STAS domain-containing protein [Streptodolium elevatio]|uniref:Anti-sigma factor antagonist n=1 Tax=Streptodolium elevatio TaxID=3157996 RepID=A0ABV3DL47_9ACTN